MPASSEFITLCHTQVALLIDGFGASLSAVYLTEDPMAEGETALVPLVIFPEAVSQWSETVPLTLLGSDSAEATSPSLAQGGFRAGMPTTILPLSYKNPSEIPSPSQLALPEELPTRLVLPLVHEEMMWGLLVVGREQSRWGKHEQAQLEQIAHTLAIACVLDQRSQWLAQGHEQRQLLKVQQHIALSTLLHQFRNPLTTLRTLGKLLLKRLKGGDANRTLVESIVGESNHLEKLLRQFDDAIDLGEAALESDLDEDIVLAQPPALPPAPNWLIGGTLTIQPCWLHEILQPSLDSIVGRVEEQNMQLHCSIPEGLPPVKADATALREVFSNLLDNALKYTPTSGNLWVSVVRNSADAVQQICFSDSGCGIPAQDLERIFERSYRGVQAQTDVLGTGLGLAIARNLVEQMGGSIQAFSPALISMPSATVGGSTFVVQLPEYAEPAPGNCIKL